LLLHRPPLHFLPIGNLLLFPLPAKGSKVWHPLVDINNINGSEALPTKEKRWYQIFSPLVLVE